MSLALYETPKTGFSRDKAHILFTTYIAKDEVKHSMRILSTLNLLVAMLISFANSLDLDQAPKNVGPDLDQTA